MIKVFQIALRNCWLVKTSRYLLSVMPLSSHRAGPENRAEREKHQENQKQRRADPQGQSRVRESKRGPTRCVPLDRGSMSAKPA